MPSKQWLCAAVQQLPIARFFCLVLRRPAGLPTCSVLGIPGLPCGPVAMNSVYGLLGSDSTCKSAKGLRKGGL